MGLYKTQGQNGAAIPRPQTDSPRQGAKALLMDGTAVDSAFALLSAKVTKPKLCVPRPLLSIERSVFEKNDFRNARPRLVKAQPPSFYR